MVQLPSLRLRCFALTVIAFGCSISSAEDSGIVVTELWHANFGSCSGYSVDISSNSLYGAVINSDSCELKIIDMETGDIKWKQFVRDKGPCIPQIIFTPDGKNLLFFDSLKPELLVIDVESGTTKQKIKLVAPLFRPRFDLVDSDGFVFAFQGQRTLEVVKINLETGRTLPFFNIRTHKEITLKRPISTSNDFLVHNGDLFVGIEGYVIAFDVNENKSRWKVKLSETALVWLAGPHDRFLIATRGPSPNILKLNIGDGSVAESIMAGEENYLGNFENFAFARNRGVIGFPEVINAYDWKTSKVVYSGKTGKTHSNPLACAMSKDGRFILGIDAMGNAVCRKISRTPANK